MSVSFDDAWNDSQFVETPPILDKMEHKVSGKKSVSLSERESEIVPPIQEKATEKDYTQYFEAMIYELNQKKKEDAKIFKVYLIFGCVLLTCILYYIEKLQSKVKDLTINIQRIQWMNLHKNTNMPISPLSEVFPWLQ